MVIFFLIKAGIFTVMQQAYIQTPLGITLIEGDESGISKIHVLNDEVHVSEEIPAILQAAAKQLEDYFNGIRKNFDFALNPQGTDFQKKVWKYFQISPCRYQ